MISRALFACRGVVILLALALVSCARGMYGTSSDTGTGAVADGPVDTKPGTDATISTPDTASNGPTDLARDQGGPELVVTQSTGKVEVSVTGRFALTFEEQYRWQASSWRDLATSPTVNLGAPGPNFEHQVVQGPMLFYYGNSWWGLGDMNSPTMAVKSTTAEQAVLETTWTWPVGDGLVFQGAAMHTISRDGTWAVTATLTNPASSDQTVSVEYADTHVAPVNGWDTTQAGDNSFYKFVRAGVPAPRPTLLATRSSAATGEILSDEAGNFYWSVAEVKLGANGSESWSWTNRIWPGE
jgi:hypothetical protein